MAVPPFEPEDPCPLILPWTRTLPLGSVHLVPVPSSGSLPGSEVPASSDQVAAPRSDRLAWTAGFAGPCPARLSAKLTTHDAGSANREHLAGTLGGPSPGSAPRMKEANRIEGKGHDLQPDPAKGRLDLADLDCWLSQGSVKLDPYGRGYSPGPIRSVRVILPRTTSIDCTSIRTRLGVLNGHGLPAADPGHHISPGLEW